MPWKRMGIIDGFNAAGNFIAAQKLRILADGGTIVDEDWMRAVISVLVQQGLMGSVKFLADANFAYKTPGAGAVSKLYDISGNNNDAVQTTGAKQPVWTAGVQNGRAGLVFDGDSLTAPDSSSLDEILDDLSILITAKLGSVATERWLCGKGGGWTRSGFWTEILAGAGIIRFGMGNGAAEVTADNTGFSDNEPCILLVNYDDLTMRLYKNSVLLPVANTNTYTYTNNNGFIIGNDDNIETLLFDGSMLNITLLNATFTTAQRTALEATVNQYYRIY